ncbi:MAG: NAD-dependent SIR2 family protein deacetylase [Parvicellaceae bacterium]|jgi:NAD-dependent SIR2 family protein deacetylase
MSRRLRVFVSSTMKDLPNERFAVVEQLKSFNVDVINAEDVKPSGYGSWETLEIEINSADIFILILGNTYGWIPEDGPKKELGLSVTHLELKHAQESNIPVLSFLKNLEYGTDSASDDARNRDAFRKEVQDWKDGYFTTGFNLANDLSLKVGDAFIGLLMDEFQKVKLQERAPAATRSTLKLDKDNKIKARLTSLPFELVDAVKTGNAVLFAGAGISLAAGLPSASAFAQSMIKLMHDVEPGYSANPTGSAFAGIATDLSAVMGRQYLVEAIAKIIDSPQGVKPTEAHFKSVELFDHIITTNYDSLFEGAMSSLNLSSDIYAEEIDGEISNRALIKLHGTIDIPSSLLLTESEVYMFDKSRPNLWNAALEELKSKVVVVVGASLHDPSIIRLFSEANNIKGYYVSPELISSTSKRVNAWNLTCIQIEADEFMSMLHEYI